MRRRIVLFFLFVSCFLWAAPKRVLYVTTAKGYPHRCRALSRKIFAELAKKCDWFEAVVTDEVSLINRRDLKNFDAVVFSNTTGDLKSFPLSADDRQALLDFVKNGGGFVGVHAATDTYKDWPRYYEMLGGVFDGHPWHEKVYIDIEDPVHPSVVHIPTPWVIVDEIYQFKHFSRNRVHVIASLSERSIGNKGKRPDRDYAICWCRNWGRGRVFYTALGHREDVWRNPVYQQHLLGGLKWVLGLAPGSARPGTKKPTTKWTPLFDGKKLDWERDWVKVGPAKWEVLPDGSIQGQHAWGHLYYKRKKFRNFEFRCEVMISPGGNSGIYFRTYPAAGKDWPDWPYGYECQINNTYPPDPRRTGSLYKISDVAKSPVKDNEWFSVHIIAVDNHIVIRLNGKVVVDVVDQGKKPRYSNPFGEGYFAFQQHHEGSVVRFRNLRVRELP